MMKRIKSDKIVTKNSLFDGYVYFEDGKIAAVTADTLSFEEEYDMTGKYVAPGFIDLHTHGGGGGHEFRGNEEDIRIAQNKLNKLQSKWKELQKQKKEEDMTSLYTLIQESGMSLEQVKQVLAGNRFQQSSQDTSDSISFGSMGSTENQNHIA